MPNAKAIEQVQQSTVVHSFPSRRAGIGVVWRQKDVIHAPQWAGRWQRLRLKNVQCGAAEVTRLQNLNERSFVHDGPAAAEC